MHKSIRKFLSDLRASTSMLVSVETRFLSVTSDFLQQVGMDFRDVNAVAGQFNRVQGISTLTDIQSGFVQNPQFQFLPPGPGLPATSAGITGIFGNNVQRSLGARIQNIMVNDQLVN